MARADKSQRVESRVWVYVWNTFKYTYLQVMRTLHKHTHTQHTNTCIYVRVCVSLGAGKKFLKCSMLMTPLQQSTVIRRTGGSERANEPGKEERAWVWVWVVCVRGREIGKPNLCVCFPLELRVIWSGGAAKQTHKLQVDALYRLYCLVWNCNQ